MEFELYFYFIVDHQFTFDYLGGGSRIFKCLDKSITQTNFDIWKICKVTLCAAFRGTCPRSCPRSGSSEKQATQKPRRGD